MNNKKIGDYFKTDFSSLGVKTHKEKEINGSILNNCDQKQPQGIKEEDWDKSWDVKTYWEERPQLDIIADMNKFHKFLTKRIQTLQIPED